MSDIVRLGQEQGREKRIAETTQWLNASPLDDRGQPLCSSEGEESVSKEVLEIELGAVRAALAADVDRIECAIDSPAIIAAIKEELEPWQLEHVVFLVEEFSKGA